MEYPPRSRAQRTGIIEALPRGWDTMLGEHGIRLCRAQREVIWSR